MRTVFNLFKDDRKGGGNNYYEKGSCLFISVFGLSLTISKSDFVFILASVFMAEQEVEMIVSNIKLSDILNNEFIYRFK